MKLGTLVRYHGHAQGRAALSQVWMVVEKHDRRRHKLGLNLDYEYTILNLQTGKTQITHWSNITKIETENEDDKTTKG